MILWISLLAFFIVLGIVGWQLDLQNKIRYKAEQAPWPLGHQTQVGPHQIFYQQTGTGPDVVLIHGLGASHHVWRKLAPLLAQHFRVTTLDLVGSGQSSKDLTISYSLEAQRLRLELFFEALQLKGSLLVGSSMGGTLALSLAAHRADLVSGVVAIAPAYFYFPRWLFVVLRAYVPILSLFMNPLTLKLFVRAVVTKFQNLQEDEFLGYMKCYLNPRESVETVIRSVETITDSRFLESLRKVQAPCLILWGKRDLMNPFWNHKKLTSRLSRSEYSSHPWAGHHVMEDDPHWTEERILELFSKISQIKHS